MVASDKLDDGVTENVLFEFETEGTAVIKTQVLKSSEETSKVPVRQLVTGLSVIEEVTIPSEKVTEMDVVTKTDESEFEGEVDVTEGELVVLSVVVSLSVVVAFVDSSFSPQEKMAKLKIMESIMRIYLKELPVRVLGIK